MRVSLCITCFNDTLFPQTGKAAVAVLERLGHQVEFPEAQTCCGQMHNNSGYQHEALALVHRFVDVFRDAEAVVIPSTSCTMTVRTNTCTWRGWPATSGCSTSAPSSPGACSSSPSF